MIEEESQKLTYDVMEEETLMNELKMGKVKDEKLPSTNQKFGEAKVGIELSIQKKEGSTQKKKAKKKGASCPWNFSDFIPPSPFLPVPKSSIIGCLGLAL